jgi:glutamyl-tRNA synthetase
MSVRVRFAPSPTGFLHVGGARTALYNWLFARHEGGVFVLRSDDTDAERSTPEFQADILATMEWLGLDWDEGIETGGPHAPYRQSERLERYREVAAALVDAGAAYHDAATSEQLDGLRRDAGEEGRSPVYRGQFRLEPGAARERIEAGEAFPVRFAVPRPGVSSFEDVVKGRVEFDHEDVDDFVILRSDGWPTYHLASTVDDVDFGITHVIRGEDILPSTPKHRLITRAMGGEPPAYAHLSLLNGPDGKKLSKRHGDTAVRAFREAGILPGTMRNYLAILGWSPGKDEEVVPITEMVKRFDLSAVSKNPAVFDTTKLEWMNGVYIRLLRPEEFLDEIRPLVEEDLGRGLDETEAAVLAEVAPHVQERARTLLEIPAQVRFLFGDLVTDDASWGKVMGDDTAAAALEGAAAALEPLDEWGDASVEAALRGMLEETGLSSRKGLQPIRVAVTGSTVSPPLFESIRILGRERSMERIREAQKRIGD